MLPEARGHRFLLYVPSSKKGENPFDFPLPENFIVKELVWPLSFFWTQLRLAWEMSFNSPDALLIPVHILPFFHPRNSVVTIHGLEYEYFPKYYSFWHRRHLRWSTKSSLKRAKSVIAVSKNTRFDLIRTYGGDAHRIRTVYHGAGSDRPAFNFRIGGTSGPSLTPYLLFVGRIEEKKNIAGILNAYKILKERYKIPHELVLAGSPGYGFENLRLQMADGKSQIKLKGYVNEREKGLLYANADMFLFPSFYEGFGLPVLEAQSAGVPVVTSFDSCLPEIAGEGALFVDPEKPAQIAQAIKTLIDDKTLRDKLIESGYENLKRFSWEKCARQTLAVLLNKS